MQEAPTSGKKVGDAVANATALSTTRRRLLLAGAALLATCGTARARTGIVPIQYFGDRMAYGPFDELPFADIPVSGATVRVGFAPGEFALGRKRILEWIAHSADAVALYYGRFPVEFARLLILPVSGGGVMSGTTYGYAGAAIKVRLGAETEERQLARDWVMVHEMVHLAFPSVARRHHWIEEGLATYVEGVARTQAGHLSLERLWAGLVEGMPNGLPADGDNGLDNTPTWGRTYWGGALFCLLADIEIRERTGNRRGLQQALRGILAAGGNMENFWPVTKAFGAGDRATGVPVLTELYAQMKDEPVNVDLTGLWRRLGIDARRDAVAFADDAPLAPIRRAITTRVS